MVIKDIFRKYPNKYESVIGVLCENLESLEASEAKASLVWIIGHYAERIDNAQELLEGFIEEFTDLDLEVQLQLLTATVKLFLKKPNTAQGVVKKVLGLATTGSTNPDLRDRGYIYWRLLSSDPDKVRDLLQKILFRSILRLCLREAPHVSNLSGAWVVTRLALLFLQSTRQFNTMGSASIFLSSSSFSRRSVFLLLWRPSSSV